MTEDEKKIRRKRLGMEREIYSVLLSFKDGAYPNQLETKMQELFGYTYEGKYEEGGVQNLRQLLMEHEEIVQLADGKFKSLANEQNRDLVELISKQKTNKKKGSKAVRGRRAQTSAGFHNRSGFGLGGHGNVSFSFKSPHSKQAKPFSFASASGFRPSSPSVFRTASALNRPPGLGPARTFNSKRTTGNNISTAATNGPSSGKTAMTVVPTQRPLVRPKTAAAVFPKQEVASTSYYISNSPQKPAKPKISDPEKPSHKVFAENFQRMMVHRVQESYIKVSDLANLYKEEYGFLIDTLGCIGKSWMDYAKYSCRDWLEMNGDVVKLKHDWYVKNSSRIMKSKKPEEVPVTKEHLDSGKLLNMGELLESGKPFPPYNQGFPYRAPTQIENVESQMKGLSIGTCNHSSTSEKPPGVRSSAHSNPTSGYTNVRSAQFDKKSPATAMAGVQRGLTVTVTDGNRSVKENHYDNNQLRNLQYVEKTAETKQNVATALNELPQLKVSEKKSTAKSRPKTVKETYSRYMPRTRNHENSPSSSLELNNSTPSSASPPTPPARMRTNHKPSGQIFLSAIADVMDNKTKESVKTSPPGINSVRPRLQEAAQVSSISQPVTEMPTVRPRSLSRPLVLPPMSKGPSVPRPPPSTRGYSRRASQSSSLDSSFLEGFRAALPDSDDGRW